ncbi:MAG: nuclear transport factor 2 family protein [Gemmatimonadaceae bacterium]|jgi:ketosteroid isomerase-like protein|nr:nuclear transport factor 2 family protein [Gemmatimonadaceae bacterium]
MVTDIEAHTRRPLPLLVCAAVVLLAGCANARPTDATATLLQLNAAYDRALLDADSVSLDSLYHPDFTYLGPGGEVRTRAQQIDALTSGRVDVLEGKSDSIVVRVYGTTATLLGRFTGRAQVGTDRFSLRERYSTTWLWDAGRWRLLVEHGTVMRNPPADSVPP